MQSQLSAREVRALFTLEGELHEVAAQSSERAVDHLAAAMPRLFGDAVMWWSVMQAPLVPVTSRVYGFDESTLRRWEQGYLLEGEYAEHPMWPGLLGEGGGQAVTRRREELVVDRDWYRSPHIAGGVVGSATTMCWPPSCRSRRALTESPPSASWGW